MLCKFEGGNCNRETNNPSGLCDMHARRDDLKAKTKRLELIGAKVQAFVDAGGDLLSPEAAPLGVELFIASNDVWVAMGNKPFLVKKEN